MMRKSNDWIFLNEEKPFFEALLKISRFHGNCIHPSHNATTNPSVVNLASCEKRAPKHNRLKNNGELGRGTCVGPRKPNQIYGILNAAAVVNDKAHDPT